MHNNFDINNLDTISVIGVGLLGGSIGLALRAAGFNGTRIGIGRRESSLNKALAYEAVDEITLDVAAGVSRAQLIIICTPIGRFEPILQKMAAALNAGTYITDVASTKVEVVKLCGRILPASVKFVGSHPMAGSEKTGVEFARADLFEHSLCIVTPTTKTPQATTRWMRKFWETIGSYTLTMTPEKHDTLLARVSHLPHAIATALVNMSKKDSAIDLAGPGFADTTRIASGDPQLWMDIFGTNRKAMIKALDQLIAELTRFRGQLDRDDSKAIHDWLAKSKQIRDRWIAKRHKMKVLPP
ncbi:MAG: prephenate dehydrogenase/arogenate dehydrogenase family protein [Planctomycetota bacterium]|nr:MAG: prephenate dehydrogenase/arogenate dehydrogenase family protein [Planctomycetota bacterium]